MSQRTIELHDSVIATIVLDGGTTLITFHTPTFINLTACQESIRVLVGAREQSYESIDRL